MEWRCEIQKKYVSLQLECRFPALPLALHEGERKVRAAQGAPLPKVEAIGDSRVRQKKITTGNCVLAMARVSGKGEKVV